MAELQPHLVTVAIPAYNAASTLDETLLSVRRQTYRDLEILVVDDGSTDATASVAQRHADADARVQLIRQNNAGVSAARNKALAGANGALFATVDADDIWHPTKVERQVRSMLNDGRKIVLSYTWFAYIDERSVVLSTAEPNDEGNVIARMCRGNLIGNGSSPVMLTRVLRDVGGWDVSLGGGNEDYKTFFLLAEQGEFSVIRSYLLGYRQGRETRSSKARRMLTSYDQVLAEIRPRYPEYADEFAAGRSELIAYLFDKAVLNAKWSAAAYLLRQARAQHQVDARKMLLNSPLIAMRMALPLSVRALLQAQLPRGRLKSRPFAQIDADFRTPA